MTAVAMLAAAKWLARLVVTVVLPDPPLGLTTRVVFILMTKGYAEPPPLSVNYFSGNLIRFRRLACGTCAARRQQADCEESGAVCHTGAMPGPTATHGDILVLGAGIVGICVALHLQQRGRATVLVDRRGAAEETSYGNAGLVQREGVYPYGFPHDFGALFRYGLNRTIDAHYHPSAIPRLAPFLWKYWHHSRPARHKAIAHLYAKLIEHCISEHEALAADAGSQDLFRRTGWMKVFRTERERDRRFAEAERWRREFGLNSD